MLTQERIVSMMWTLKEHKRWKFWEIPDSVLKHLDRDTLIEQSVTIVVSTVFKVVELFLSQLYKCGIDILG